MFTFNVQQNGGEIVQHVLRDRYTGRERLQNDGRSTREKKFLILLNFCNFQEESIFTPGQNELTVKADALKSTCIAWSPFIEFYQFKFFDIGTIRNFLILKYDVSTREELCNSSPDRLKFLCRHV